MGARDDREAARFLGCGRRRRPGGRIHHSLQAVLESSFSPRPRSKTVPLLGLIMTAGATSQIDLAPARKRAALRALGAALALAALVSVAAAQQAAPPPAGVAPQPPPVILATPPSPDAPAAAAPRILPTPSELFSGIGRLIDQSIANVNAGVK